MGICWRLIKLSNKNWTRGNPITLKIDVTSTKPKKKCGWLWKSILALRYMEKRGSCWGNLISNRMRKAHIKVQHKEEDHGVVHSSTAFTNSSLIKVPSFIKLCQTKIEFNLYFKFIVFRRGMSSGKIQISLIKYNYIFSLISLLSFFFLIGSSIDIYN